jgi:hypothetical protein
MKLSIIDDVGMTWPGASRRLREAYDSPYSGGEFLEYAAANLGFVVISSNNRSCQIRLRPSFVKPATWRAVAATLHALVPERTVVTWLDDEWRDELIGTWPRLSERLAELQEAATGHKPPVYMRREVAASELHPASVLGRIVREWTRYAKPAARQELRELVGDTVGDRYVIARLRSDTGRIVFEEFGAGLYTPYETWCACAVGAPIEEQPDRDYGRWVADAYYSVLARGTPEIADVDAIVRWPHAGRCRMRYKRLIVPLPSATEAPVLLGGSILDDRVDLRLALA